MFRHPLADVSQLLTTKITVQFRSKNVPVKRRLPNPAANSRTSTFQSTGATTHAESDSRGGRTPLPGPSEISLEPAWSAGGPLPTSTDSK